MKTKKEIILGTIDDLIAKFLYYDRKDDEDLRVYEIEKSIEAEEISLEEIKAKFCECLEKNLGEYSE